jgi:hypothetical protein
VFIIEFLESIIKFVLNFFYIHIKISLKSKSIDLQQPVSRQKSTL